VSIGNAHAYHPPFSLPPSLSRPDLALTGRFRCETLSAVEAVHLRLHGFVAGSRAAWRTGRAGSAIQEVLHRGEVARCKIRLGWLWGIAATETPGSDEGVTVGRRNPGWVVPRR